MKLLYVGELACVLAGIIWAGNANGNTLELARDGKADYAIIQSTNATLAETFAAQELSAFLEKATGAKFAIISDTNQPLPKKGMYVGWTDVAGQCADRAKLGDEEWIIKSIGENLVLTGGRPRGTLYAVYEFLEQQVGCHWFDEFTETIPAQPSLVLKKMDIHGQPAFWDRQCYSAIEVALGYGAETQDFRARNKDVGTSLAKYGATPTWGSPGGCHTFYSYSKEWPTNHPEYLAMNANGERVVAKDGGGPGQICLTHPEVRKLMLQQLKVFIAKDREKAAKAGLKPPRVYAIEPNDNHWSCLCPECKAFTEREEAASGPLIDLVNSLADGIKDEYPDVLVETFAYSDILKPPKTIRPRANVMIRLAQLNAEYGSDVSLNKYGSPDFYPDLFLPMNHAVNQKAYALVVTWSKIAKHMAYWDYWRKYSFDTFPSPYVNMRCLQPDLKFFRDCGIEVMFVENENVSPTSFFALKRWVGLKLMQNPDQDAKHLIKTFMDAFYGPATGKMTEYLNYLEDRIAAVPQEKTGKMSAMQIQERPYLDLEFYKTSQRLLDEAEAQCGTNTAALLNVRVERIPVDAALYCMWDKLAKQLPAGQPMPWDREQVIKRYETNRLAQVESRWAKDRRQAGKDILQKEIRAFREMALVNQRKAEKPLALRVAKLADAAAAGDPSKVDWTKAAPIGPWRTLNDSEGIPARNIKGALAHDGKYLYISLEEILGSAKLSSTADMWSGDDWELFFAAARDRAFYRQIAISPDGKHIDYEWIKQSPAVWTNSASIKSDTNGGRWQVLFSMPLAELVPNGVKTGQPFYMNVFRGAPAPGEPMCWSPTFDKGFHDVTRLAEITLE